MKTFASIALAGIASAELSSDIEIYKFVQYLAEHNKTYDTQDEFQTRFDRFVQIDEQIQMFNEEASSTSTVGHN